MVHTCTVYGCHNRSSDTVKCGFFCIPAIITREGEHTEEMSRNRREKWISQINRRDYQPSAYTKVCADHFVTGRPAKLYDSTHPDWAPSLKMVQHIEEAGDTDMGRYNRVQQRKERQKLHTAAESLLDMSCVPLHQHDDALMEVNSNSSCKFFLSGPLNDIPFPVDSKDSKETLVTTSEKKQHEAVRTNHQRLLIENIEMREKVTNHNISESSFNDDVKVAYYTGLPSFLMLMTVFNFVKDDISENSRSCLTKFQKLVLVLMKLRLNCPLQDLAYRFDVSQSTVLRVFLSVVHVLFIKLQELIHWPDHEQLRMTMPMTFRKHFGRKVAVIIDCFEIFIEWPSNFLARAKTWLSYKHHNTIKFLIGITPQGSISFISRAWGGRSSDKYITEHCGFLDKLLPGDLVLADRGFDIQESVGLYCAEVKIPGFTKGKSQLPPLEVERTRNIAHVRIHVKRVIGLVRNKYTIMQGTMPIDYLINAPDDLPAADKIVTESVVPFN